MRRVILLVLFADTFRATLTSGLLVLGSLVILQTQLSNSASADVTFLNKWGSLGSGDGQCDYTWDVAVSETGQVYVFTNYRVQRFDADGNYETQWGSSGTGDREFYLNPIGIAVSASGQVYVADIYNNRIQRFFDSEACVSIVLQSHRHNDATTDL